jgi:hypothetical protein
MGANVHDWRWNGGFQKLKFLLIIIYTQLLEDYLLVSRVLNTKQRDKEQNFNRYNAQKNATTAIRKVTQKKFAERKNMILTFVLYWFEKFSLLNFLFLSEDTL